MDDGKIERLLQAMEQRLTEKLEIIMSEQSQQQIDVNNAGTAIIALLTDMQADISTIGTGVASITAALAALPASVDTTQLDADVAQIAAAQASLDAAAASVANAVPPVTPPAS
ncbi:MAG TPA: hypothetical protein VGG75_38535 [Trebonia sp.]